MNTHSRRHDIDYLRVIAIALLLIYHTAIVFQPWGVLIGFMQSAKSLEGLWIPMSLINIWRIPLLFFISGMGLSFALRKRNLKQLLLERTQRIFIPFLVGMLTLVPIHIVLWQKYYSQDVAYTISRGHLWFLGNIMAYVVLFSPLFLLLKKNKGSKMHQKISKAFSSPVGLAIVMLLFVGEIALIKPDAFELYAMNWHGFFIGFLAFFFGYIFIWVGKAFWVGLVKWRFLYFTLAAALFTLRLFHYNLEAPNLLKAIESNLWIFTLLAFAYKYLNKPAKYLPYFSKAAYPVYVVHMIFLYLGSYFILPLELSPLLSFIILLIITFSGSLLSYELLLKRIPILVHVFGIRIWTPKSKPGLTKPVVLGKAVGES